VSLRSKGLLNDALDSRSALVSTTPSLFGLRATGAVPLGSSRGLFVAIEGPSGIGKSTVAGLVKETLLAQGIATISTTEPSPTPLGDYVRKSTFELRNVALACLVAADRYQHLETEVYPALERGDVVICDRYVASSLVLQCMDGVDESFVLAMNRYARMPDLTVFLFGDMARNRKRAVRRGTYSRFHHCDSEMETNMYSRTASRMVIDGHDVMCYDIDNQTAATVAGALVEGITLRLGR
jgi:dTMP kinase